MKHPLLLIALALATASGAYAANGMQEPHPSLPGQRVNLEYSRDHHRQAKPTDVKNMEKNVGPDKAIEDHIPLYITGAATNFTNGTWNPEQPDEFLYVDGKYVFDTTEMTMIKISTEYGSWEIFDAAALTCDYGHTAGATVALEPVDLYGTYSNIYAPWKGDWHIEVSGNRSTITMTTTTPRPTEITELYLRGTFNDWAASEDWKMQSTDGITYTFTCTGKQIVKEGEMIKVAERNWGNSNYGFDSFDGEIIPDVEYTWFYNGKDAIMAEDWYGKCTVVLPGDRTAYVTFSNKGFTHPEDDPVLPPVNPGKDLYIVGNASNLTWEITEPAKFTYQDGLYTFDVTDGTIIKISTAAGDWDAFNESALTCDTDGKTDSRVQLPLTRGDANIILPWQGNWHLEVPSDLSTITMTTETPRPEGYAKVYLRGDMNNWEAVPEWEMTTKDGVTYTFTCKEGQEITANDTFKVADQNWVINYGTDDIVSLDVTTPLEGNSMSNMALDEDWNGTCTFILNADKTATILFTNGQVNPPVTPNPIEGYYVWSHIAMDGADGYINTTWKIETGNAENEVIVTGIFKDYPVKAQVLNNGNTLRILPQQLADNLFLRILEWENDTEAKAKDSFEMHLEKRMDVNLIRAEFNDILAVEATDADSYNEFAYGNLIEPIETYLGNKGVKKVFEYKADEWTGEDRAEFADGWYAPILEESLGTYEVTMQTSELYPNMVLLKDPYGENTPFRGTEGYIIIDLSTEIPTIVPLVMAGAIPDYANTTTESHLRYLCNYSDDMIRAYIAENKRALSSYTTDAGTSETTVTLENCLFSPVYDLLSPYHWNIGDTKSTMIRLPHTPGAVGTITDESSLPVRYFNLQGIETTRPAAGEIVIEKRGDKTRKVMFK